MESIFRTKKMTVHKRTFFKVVGPYVAALAVLVLAVLLVVVIYFTQFTLPWIAFLTGVLAAAILSMVSRASKAEWIIARREAKISSLQDKLAKESRLRRELEQKLADSLELETAGAEKTSTVAVTNVPVPSAPETTVQDMFVQSLSEQMVGPNDAINRILSAIEHNEFRLYCQRIAPLPASPAQDSHYEVLIRLIEEEEGMMPPGAFFPLVEKYGLMPQLDRWVVQHVIEWLSARRAPAPLQSGSTFFVNLAAASLRDREFPKFVSDQLRRHKLSARELCFEISETDLSLMHDEVVFFAKEIRNYGCMVAICDFGRDGVSFGHLHKIRVDFLKIDGNIILDILRDPADLAQVVAIARVARTISIKTIAELVESDACVAKLREIGVDYAQGFGVSLPSPLDDIIAPSHG